MAFLYVFKTFCNSFLLFFVHWYWDGFSFVYGKTLALLRGLERHFALRASLYFLFKPLYQERNVIGYVLGFSYRLVRITLGGFLALLLCVLATAVYIFWALVPAYMLYKALFYWI